MKIKKILIATDSFKDSLPAAKVCRAIAMGIQRIAPKIECVEIPLADGGEGTALILSQITNAQWIEVNVRGPLGRIVKAGYGWDAISQSVFIDMAQSSGLQLLKPEERNPLETSTYGLGQLLLEGLKHHPKRIVIGIGGSATNDGGIGMANALGYQFLDQSGQVLIPVGKNLNSIHKIIPPSSNLIPKEIIIDVLCDVNNPLYGPEGAAMVFAAQKGATSDMIHKLDLGLQNLASRLNLDLGIQVDHLPGGGAAGGLGAGIFAFLGGALKPGVQTILETIHFVDYLREADLVITGEGKIDNQTAGGKLISGICSFSNAQQVPVIAICGSLLAQPAIIQKIGLQAAFSILNQPLSLADALSQSEQLLQDTSANIIQLLRLT